MNDFTMQSRLKAQKQASASHGHSGAVQKGHGGKPNVGVDSISVQKATSAPKVNTQVGIHKADPSTAPKMATFQNDRTIQAGEFESNASESTADTGHGSRGAVRGTESGEFESTPAPSHADTGTGGAAVQQTQSGEFESQPEARQW
eukprot:TRINITY_DN136_c0_g1_i1.p1 TRINITY_DN136_c0_g1~~TRINITY_DN136_c0_g1_i1.p1  ORF type:complete len:146 (-),score=24.23 TRINITY_DN136_c0_g1_i1:110-547(-)